MMSSLVKRQLRLFVAITSVVLAVMALYYVELPARLGIGRYDLSVQLQEGAGLYPRSLVTYNGVEVGQVSSLDLRTDGGVTAHLEIDNGTEIPANSIAHVRSASVVGEQYLDFVALNRASEGDDGYLDDGAIIPSSRTVLPTTTNELITATNDFLASVPKEDLRTVIRELGLATDGVGTDLGRLLDAGGELTTEAQANLDETTALINDLDPVLATQDDLSPHIRRYSASLRGLTGELESSDDDVAAILQNGSDFMNSAGEFTNALGEEAPGILWETAATGKVVRVYRDYVEHVLTVLPATIAAGGAAIPEWAQDDYKRQMYYFKATFPTPCTEGFPEKNNYRDPSDVSLGPLPQDSYCRAPVGSSLVVRGARNTPCPNSAARAARPAGCGLVFDPAAVTRADALPGAGDAMLDPTAVRFVTPNGPLFLLDPGSSPGPQSWQSLLKRLVRR